MEHLRRLADTLRQALTDATDPNLPATPKPGPLKVVREARDGLHGRQRFTRAVD